MRSVQRHGLLGRGQRLEVEVPAPACAVIGDRPVEADDPLVRLPRNGAQTDRIPRVDVLRQPARHRLRSLHVGHQQQEVRLRAVALHRRQQQLDPQTPAFRFQVVGFVHHDQRERTFHLPVPDHQRQLLGRRDQYVEGLVPVAEQRFLERVHLDGRGQLLDTQPDRREVCAQTPRDLRRQRPGRGDVDDPSSVVPELVQRLEDAKLREQRLATRGRHVDNDRGLCLVEQPLFEQRGALRRQELEHRLVLAVRERAHELRGPRVDRPGRPPQRIRHHDARRRMQPPEQHLVLRVPRSGRRPDSRLEMLVQRAERITRRALEHVAREGLGRLRPVVERRQPERDRPVHRLSTVSQATFFMDRLVVAQARNDLADAIEIVPPILPE